MAGDAAQTAASKVKPSEDQLNAIDEPAPDNTWHDVPDLSKDKLKAQLKDQYSKQKPVGKDDLQQAGNNAYESAAQRTNEVNGVADQNGNVDQGAAQDVAGTGLNTAASQLKNQARENVPDETQDQLKEHRDKAVGKSKDYLSKKMPKERREQTIWRLKKMVVEIQGHSDCKWLCWL